MENDKYTFLLFKMGFAADHAVKMEFYRKKFKNGIAIEFNSASPNEILKECNQETITFLNKVKECDQNIGTDNDSISEKCYDDAGIEPLFECYRGVMQKRYDNNRY
ncbi:hypothetical protein CE11_00029 [Megavirus courdo11]|nr:hypothetical protein CE11_00029 [Megavirus courdo11]AGD91933.1 hypothetical protein LBA_00010 [Megavirus lba]AUV58014.1 hypothetical protein [Bandra megavirus]AVL93395.1 hypothetical protein mvi_35 [Megavirus vitis]